MEILLCGGVFRPPVPAAWSPVIGLFLPCRPAAVLGAIWAVVVASIKGVSLRGTGAHISEEPRKRVAPRLTDSDSASAIAFVRWCGCHVAAALQFYPDLVLGRLGSMVPRVAQSLSRRGFSVKTSAAAGAAGAKKLAHRRNVAAAITPTEPSSITRLAIRIDRRARHNDESRKALAYDVLCSRRLHWLESL